MGTLYLDENGYSEYLNKIKEVEIELEDLRKYKGKEAIYQGDMWHDNPTLVQTEMQERALLKKLGDMKNKLQNIEVVKEVVQNLNIIDINDIVKLRLIFSDGEQEESLYKLVASNFPKETEQYEEISLNSVLGKTIYKESIGAKKSYCINENFIEVEILEMRR